MIDLSNKNNKLEFITDYLKSIITPGAHIALSGGSTPIGLFDYLSTVKDIDFANLNFSLVDERLVNSLNADSNEYLVRKHLLQNNAVNANFIGIAPHDIDEVEAKSDIICDLLNHEYRPIDIALLGMGNDGHFASIFPDCDELSDAVNLNNKASYIVTRPKSAKYTRISLTLRAITNIPHLILLISGQQKIDIINSVTQSNTNCYPISYLMRLRKDLRIFNI